MIQRRIFFFLSYYISFGVCSLDIFCLLVRVPLYIRILYIVSVN